jgi:hypothetical protein
MSNRSRRSFAGIPAGGVCGPVNLVGYVGRCLPIEAQHPDLALLSAEPKIFHQINYLAPLSISLPAVGLKLARLLPLSV